MVTKSRQFHKWLINLWSIEVNKGADSKTSGDLPLNNQIKLYINPLFHNQGTK